jgi:CspA family cold shock protein
MNGTVKKWLSWRGYGFIEPDEGEKDIFVHFSEIGEINELEEGQQVEFEVQDTDKGPRAINVKIV